LEKAAMQAVTSPLGMDGLWSCRFYLAKQKGADLEVCAFEFVL
jgi:hypothetical protein